MYREGVNAQDGSNGNTQHPCKMKAGDVCRCISDFSGISADELTLYKNDLVQVG